MELLAVLIALIAAFILSEIALRGTKLQTGLVRVLAVFAVVYAATLWYLLKFTGIGWLAFTLFWAGSFLSWFGVRSHIESSILMRMLYLLRGSAQPDDQLVKDYISHYGEQMRLEELEKGSMIQRTPDGIVVTPKGRFILKIVALLR